MAKAKATPRRGASVPTLAMALHTDDMETVDADSLEPTRKRIRVEIMTRARDSKQIEVIREYAKIETLFDMGTQIIAEARRRLEELETRQELARASDDSGP